METIAAAHSFLDRQESLAIWHAAYHDLEESIVYANPFFCETFGLTLDDVLERRRYHLSIRPTRPRKPLRNTKPKIVRPWKSDTFFSAAPSETAAT